MRCCSERMIAVAAPSVPQIGSAGVRARGRSACGGGAPGVEERAAECRARAIRLTHLATCDSCQGQLAMSVHVLPRSGEQGRCESAMPACEPTRAGASSRREQVNGEQRQQVGQAGQGEHRSEAADAVEDPSRVLREQHAADGACGAADPDE